MTEPNQNKYEQEHNSKTNEELNDTHGSTAKNDKPISVGENDENHTVSDTVKYQEEGKDSQQSKAGQNGKKVHTDNQGGTPA